MASDRLIRKLRSEWLGEQNMRLTLLQRLKRALGNFLTALVMTSYSHRMSLGPVVRPTDSSESEESLKPSARKRSPRARVNRTGFKSKANSTLRGGRKDG